MVGCQRFERCCSQASAALQAVLVTDASRTPLVPRARFELARSGISNRCVYPLRHLGTGPAGAIRTHTWTASETVSSAKLGYGGKRFTS